MTGYLQYKLKAIRSITFLVRSFVVEIDIEPVASATDATNGTGVAFRSFATEYEFTTAYVYSHTGHSAASDILFYVNASTEALNGVGQSVSQRESVNVTDNVKVTLWLREWPLTLFDAYAFADTAGYCVIGSRLEWYGNASVEDLHCTGTLTARIFGVPLEFGEVLPRLAVSTEAKLGNGKVLRAFPTGIMASGSAAVKMAGGARLRDHDGKTLAALDNSTLANLYYNFHRR